MTLHDLNEFVLRTIPGAIGTALYAFTQLGPVAWVTIAWVLVQLTRFCLQWYREERALYLRRKRQQALEDADEEGYPGDMQ